MKTKYLILITLLLAFGSGQAQEVVKNFAIDQGFSQGMTNSINAPTININGTRYFTANDGIHGTELWKSDGTAAGTVMVKDIVPGQDGPDFGNPNLFKFVNAGGTIYFSIDDNVNGRELWKSDGTIAGTVMVMDLSQQGTLSSTPVLLGSINNILYFSADDQNGSGFELWKTDGTEGGTDLVKDINIGAGGSNVLRDFVNINVP